MFVRKIINALSGVATGFTFAFELTSHSQNKKPKIKTEFEEVDSGTQAFNLASAFTEPTPSTDISGFTGAPRGAFAGQGSQFKRQAMGQLPENRHVIAMRGDARPLPEILSEGIKPRAANGRMDVEEHRGGLTHKSGCVSLSTKMSVAVVSGANAAASSTSAVSEVVGIADSKAVSGSFTVIAAKLSGSKYNVAGPGRIKVQESEVTTAGPIDRNDILAYRTCVRPANGSQFATCSGIFARSNLSLVDKAVAVSALQGLQVNINKPL